MTKQKLDEARKLLNSSDRWTLPKSEKSLVIADRDILIDALDTLEEAMMLIDKNTNFHGGMGFYHCRFCSANWVEESPPQSHDCEAAKLLAIWHDNAE